MVMDCAVFCLCSAVIHVVHDFVGFTTPTTASSGPTGANIRDAIRRVSLARVRAHPPTIDAGIRISELLQFPAADPVRQAPTCYAVCHDCNALPTISKSNADVLQTPESFN